jgi:hypothetical protein
MKVCIQCLISKSEAEFYKDHSRKSGLDPRCIPCSKEHTREWVVKNKTKVRTIKTRYAKANKDACIQRTIAWQKSNKPKAIRARIASTLRSRLTDALRRHFKGAYHRPTHKTVSAVENLGCTIPEFIKYIEAKFQPGMTWDNRGFGPGKWQLDHIVPFMNIDLFNRDQLLKVVHYTNYQPLWDEDHTRKSLSERGYTIYT